MKKFLSVRNLLIASTFLLAVFTITSCTTRRRSIAVEQGWDLLGERKVNFVKDKDDFPVQDHNKFTAVRFRVEDRDIHLSNLKIYFENGDKLEPMVDDIITAGQSSRLIEIGAEGRYIDHIEFSYRTTGNILKGRADVLVFGKRYSSY